MNNRGSCLLEVNSAAELEEPLPKGPLLSKSFLVEGTGGCAPLIEGTWLIANDSCFQYLVYPERGADAYAATYACLDVLFEDGTRLSEIDAADQYGFPLKPRAQGDAQALYVDQWNLVRCDLGKEAVGKTAVAVMACLDAPDRESKPRAWFSEVEFGTTPDASAPPVDLVDTRRGSNSTPMFSRGNTFPAVAVPNGFSLISPATDASRDWFYAWSRHNNDDGYTPFAGFVFSHAPSPWMGDRAQLTVAPSWGEPLMFLHRDEVARPYLWSATLMCGQSAEATPTDHGGILRFRSPNSNRLRLTLGSIEGQNQISANVDSHEVWGWVEEGSGLSTGHSRMFFYGRANHPWAGVDHGNGQTTLDSASPDLELRIATSFISSGQARHAFELELANREWSNVEGSARAEWSKRLEILELPEATWDQKVAAYSNLYRVNLYPTSHTENLGTVTEPVFAYASPVLEPTGRSSDEQTGAVVVDGQMYVNHGFWDTYRTVWPLYALLYPEQAGRLADGFVEFARTGGWTPRWASPGYADLMPGTSSDAAFADLYTKDVPLPDPYATYEAGLRNATASPTEPGVGRRDAQYRFLPFPMSDLPEAVAWAAEAGVNDAALAQMAEKLASQANDLQRERLECEARYLARRSLSYRHGFDKQADFFRSHVEGSTHPEGAFDPLTWGGDYTETNAWDYAFLAPHDGEGLSELYGSLGALEEKLDEYFTTPENGDRPGTYGGAIHEMFEARETRMGQFGVSNQPAHHVPFTYHLAGRPDKASAVSRAALKRLFRGSAIGQGYPGDEDNGEMSAWHLFAMTGLFPLQVGFPRYAIVAPAVQTAIWHLPDGDLKVKAKTEDDFANATAVESLTIDGVQHTTAWIDHMAISKGAELEFTLSGESAWGTQPQHVLPSIEASPLGPWRDLTPRADIVGRGFTDGAIEMIIDDSLSPTVSVNRGSTLTFDFGEERPEILTLTCGPSPHLAPTSWRVVASADGNNWAEVASFTNERFQWPGQTRPFCIKGADDSARYFRLIFEDSGELAQLEALT